MEQKCPDYLFAELINALANSKEATTGRMNGSEKNLKLKRLGAGFKIINNAGKAISCHASHYSPF